MADFKAGREDDISNIVVITNSWAQVTGKIINEEIVTEITNEWISVGEEIPALPGGAILDAITTRAKAGIKASSKKIMYPGSDYFSLTLELEFVTYRDPLVDVIAPVLLLNKMSLPGERVGMFGIIDKVTVNIGGFIIITKAIIQNININWNNVKVKSPQDQKNYPLKAQVSLTISTDTKISRNDIDKIYQV